MVDFLHRNYLNCLICVTLSGKDCTISGKPQNSAINMQIQVVLCATGITHDHPWWMPMSNYTHRLYAGRSLEALKPYVSRITLKYKDQNLP